VIDEVRRVRDYIVNQYVVRDEVRSIDRDASVVPDGQSIETDKQLAVRREEQNAHVLSEPFNTALLLAWIRKTRGGTELQLDDRDPEQNSMADALIQFLVRFDLATSRTEETDPMHYTYYISVDWDRLFAIAASQEIALESALSKHAAGVNS
jgi:hypothetical protein